jgi:hypothetical protein
MVPAIASPMLHRHLREGVSLSGPALDDIVSRGSWAEWGALRDILLTQPALREPFQSLCAARVADADAPTARYRVWLAHLSEIAAS